MKLSALQEITTQAQATKSTDMPGPAPALVSRAFNSMDMYTECLAEWSSAESHGYDHADNVKAITIAGYALACAVDPELAREGFPKYIAAEERGAVVGLRVRRSEGPVVEVIEIINYGSGGRIFQDLFETVSAQPDGITPDTLGDHSTELLGIIMKVSLLPSRQRDASADSPAVQLLCALRLEHGDFIRHACLADAFLWLDIYLHVTHDKDPNFAPKVSLVIGPLHPINQAALSFPASIAYSLLRPTHDMPFSSKILARLAAAHMEEKRTFTFPPPLSPSRQSSDDSEAANDGAGDGGAGSSTGTYARRVYKDAVEVYSGWKDGGGVEQVENLLTVGFT